MNKQAWPILMAAAGVGAAIASVAPRVSASRGQSVGALAAKAPIAGTAASPLVTR